MKPQFDSCSNREEKFDQTIILGRDSEASANGRVAHDLLVSARNWQTAPTVRIRKWERSNYAQVLAWMRCLCRNLWLTSQKAHRENAEPADDELIGWDSTQLPGALLSKIKEVGN